MQLIGDIMKKVEKILSIIILLFFIIFSIIQIIILINYIKDPNYEIEQSSFSISDLKRYIVYYSIILCLNLVCLILSIIFIKKSIMSKIIITITIYFVLVILILLFLYLSIEFIKNNNSYIYIIISLIVMLGTILLTVLYSIKLISNRKTK